MRIPLSGPDVTEAEVQAVAEVLRGRQLSLGPWLERFERELCSAVGASDAVAVNSGTGALHLTLLAMGLGPGDEVLTTPFSFVASANAILHAGAHPVFADIDPRTFNVDPERVEKALTSKTRALLPVHVFGRPAAMQDLLAIAERRGLRVVEDACEAFGGRLDGDALGTLGHAGVYAFYPNKAITTGEGGAVVTCDGALARRARSLRNQGRDPRDGRLHTELGYSFRLSEMACALGAGQLRRLNEILLRRQAIARHYLERLSGQEDLLLPATVEEADDRGWFVFVVQLRSRFSAADRDRIARALESRGIGCGRYFVPIHLQPYYRREFGYGEGDFPIAESVAERTLALPFFNRIRDEQIDEVCDALIGACAGP